MPPWGKTFKDKHLKSHHLRKLLMIKTQEKKRKETLSILKENHNGMESFI